MMRVVAKDKAVGERYEEGRGDHEVLLRRGGAQQRRVRRCSQQKLVFGESRR
jgi:hypothetical protein